MLAASAVPSFLADPTPSRVNNGGYIRVVLEFGQAMETAIVPATTSFEVTSTGSPLPISGVSWLDATHLAITLSVFWNATVPLDVRFDDVVHDLQTLDGRYYSSFGPLVVPPLVP